MSVPDSAKGAVALALVWAGVVAFIGIALTLAVGPMVGALGCPGGCPGDDSVMMRVVRLAFGIAAAYAVLAGVVVALVRAARRTRLAGLGLAIVGAALLVPTATAVGEVVRGDASAIWPPVPFVGLGVPGLALVYAGVTTLRGTSRDEAGKAQAAWSEDVSTHRRPDR